MAEPTTIVVRKRCKYCGYTESMGFMTGAPCQCVRCVQVRASGYCNEQHEEFFKEEMALALRKEGA